MEIHGEPAPDSEPAVQAWEWLLRAHAALVPRVARDVEEATGLPLAWYDVLLELNRAEGRSLRVQELSDRVVLSRSRVSRVLDAMEAEGLVGRSPDPADGRASLIAPTASGRGKFRQAAPVYLSAIGRRFAASLTPDQAQRLAETLQQVSIGSASRGGDA